jgi:hypothetical protein
MLLNLFGKVAKKWIESYFINYQKKKKKTQKQYFCGLEVIWNPRNRTKHTLN